MNTSDSYLICTNPRSGSKLLCDTLGQYPCFGKPDEYFHPDNAIFKDFFQDKKTGYPNSTELQEYLHTISQTTQGYKFMWETFDQFKKALNIENTENYDHQKKLQTYFPQTKYIWLTRNNKVQQAISWARAISSNVWYSSKNDFIKQIPTISLAEIETAYTNIIQLDRHWHMFFLLHQITPLCLTYEYFIEKPAETLIQIAKFLDIAAPKIDTVLFNSKKLADESSLRLEQEYRNKHPES